MPRDPEFLTAGQAAVLMGVCARTIVKWSREGKIPHAKTLGGHRRYLRAEILALVEANTSPIK